LRNFPEISAGILSRSFREKALNLQAKIWSNFEHCLEKKNFKNTKNVSESIQLFIVASCNWLNLTDIVQ